ncbi:MAG: hypothetical protein COV75_04015 [Candidatus Omnitrophica bacterium CG11_big_fil_rev_8_21_14_0_20_63_9]|nr:MAG: hypothetical protein COV75_04015 [Candidatus Omnitrophica bacterium CG11_big_fil_rev_8_21_14_0_20_63_9]
MSALKVLGTAARVGGTFASYLTFRAVRNPRASREFFKTVANTIVDFRPEPNAHLKTVSLEEFFPGITHAATQPLDVTQGVWEAPPAEYECLAKLATHLKPRTVFEFGTYRGRTTRLLAEHAVEQARIYTLELDPEETRRRWGKPSELVGQAFRQTPLERKIVQLYTDDRTFDFQPYYGAMDLIFIDANHRYEAVKRDTAEALRMIKPGGVVVWDDYRPQQPGVMHCVNELARRVSGLAQVQGTRFACYKAPRT